MVPSADANTTITTDHGPRFCLPKPKQPSTAFLQHSTTIAPFHRVYPSTIFLRIESAFRCVISLLKRTFFNFFVFLRRLATMPSPSKRSFAQFAQDYTNAFPITPTQFHNGWPVKGLEGEKKRREEYEARIEYAYRVEIRDPSIDPTRYMPGGYPDGVLLPQPPVESPLLFWGSIKLYNGARMAQIAYNTARNVYHKTRRTVKATQQMVIEAIAVIGGVKRRAIQVVSRRSNQEIVRNASRLVSIRQSSPNRRQRSHRPSSPPPSSSSSGADQQQYIHESVQSSTHQHVETASSTFGKPEYIHPSVEATPHQFIETTSLNLTPKPLDLLEALEDHRRRSGKKQQKSGLQLTEVSGNRVAKVKPLQQGKCKFIIIK
jgi:hypothetical protein